MSQSALSLPFDCYERYWLTGRILPLLWPEKGHPALRVLDVGGRSSPLKHFVPKDVHVVATDILPPDPYAYRPDVPLLHDGYVIGAGQALPFADASFDLVTAHDTLEHIVEHDRPAFLRELLRVARRFVILNGPMHHPETVRAERRLAQFWRRGLGWEQHALIEHLEKGLPEREEIEKTLGDEGASFVSIPNGNLAVWLAMMTIKHQLESAPPAARAHEALDRTFNELLADRDFGGLCYRDCLIVATTAADGDQIERARRGLEPLAARSGRSEAVEPLRDLVNALEDHAVRVRRGVERLGEALEELNVERAVREEAEAALRERDALVAELRERVDQAEWAAEQSEKALDRLTTSTSHHVVAGIVRVINRLAPWGTRRRSLLLTPMRGMGMLLREGWLAFLRRLGAFWLWIPRMFRREIPNLERLTSNERYELWLRLRFLSRRSRRRMRGEARNFGYRPTISLVMPAYNSRPEWLRDAFRSLRRQVYADWELCIADDGSTRRDTRRYLGRLARRDRRVKTVALEENRGISAASNAALGLATGEFVGLIDHDDELKPNALFEIVKLLNRDPSLDFIYTDEDKRDPDGNYVDPFFKPSWSPDLLMAGNYITHLSVFRRKILEQVGGFREGYEGSQDYDLILRVTERTDRVGHVPLPLYTWRQVPGSAAESPHAKPKAYRAAKQALADALGRRGLPGTVEAGENWGYYRVRYEIGGSPRVAIVVRAADRPDALRECVRSLVERTSYPRFDLLLVDGGALSADTADLLSEHGGRVLRSPARADIWRSLNGAARETDADFLVFLAGDVRVLDEDWVGSMLEHAQRSSVGPVGLRLLSPEGRPVHEGLLVGAEGGLPRPIAGSAYFGMDRVVRNVSAVSGACMMIRSDVFWDLDGFDEEFSVSHADADLCLRAGMEGLLTVYTPHARLFRDEVIRRAASRVGGSDEKLFRERWSGYRDRFYNPNLDLDEPFALRLEL